MVTAIESINAMATVLPMSAMGTSSSMAVAIERTMTFVLMQLQRSLYFASTTIYQNWQHWV